MYLRVEVTLAELLPLTGEPSMDALRARAHGSILRYIRSNGPLQYYDRDLSAVRCKAARRTKRPGVTWSRIEASVAAQDSIIDARIVELLNREAPQNAIVEEVADMIRTKLR